MDLTDLCLDLLNTNQITVQDIRIESDQIAVFVESRHEKACCPKCAQESSEIHSYYLRYPRDLAWAHLPVILHLKVKRFFCQNRQCAKQTFAERFPDFVGWYARKTKRVVEKQDLLSINVCARTAEVLLRMEQIGISDTTVNRNLRGIPDPEVPPIRVLGVDDWAKRKGQRYGTILVDQERARVVDVLEDRTAETLAKWLGTHPEIKIVTRDRSKTYAEGIRQGAKQAVQVADRWHLLKNGSDVLDKVFQQENSAIQKQLKEIVEQTGSTTLPVVEPPTQEDTLTLAEQHRKERITQAQELIEKGWTRKAAARHLNIHPKTVRRYLDDPSPKFARSRGRGILEPFKPFILQRWNEGCHNATQIFREIRMRGYCGHETLVIDYARELRQASGIPPRVRKHTGEILPVKPTQELPTLRTLAWWVYRPVEKRKTEDEQVLERLSAGQPKLKSVIELARDYAALIRHQKAEGLTAWIERAKQSEYAFLRNFAEGIQQDETAIRAALSYSWSNGRTEGNVNRLKCIKRLMYGRAKDDLLRKRVLWQGHNPFT